MTSHLEFLYNVYVVLCLHRVFLVFIRVFTHCFSIFVIKTVSYLIMSFAAVSSLQTEQVITKKRRCDRYISEMDYGKQNASFTERRDSKLFFYHFQLLLQLQPIILPFPQSLDLRNQK